MPATVVVAGGGIGGLVAARRLRRLLPKRHRVVLVDREPDFVFAPSLLWVTTGARSPEAISRPLAPLERRGIEVVRGEIERIEPSRREVVVAGRALAGDHLVLALGADLDPGAVPGLARAGHDFYSLRGALALRDAFESFAGGRLVVLTAAPAYKCPAAPYEEAMLLEARCRERGIRERTRIDLYAAEPGPMGVAGPEVSKPVRDLLEARGIGYHPGHQVTEADPAARRLRFGNGAEAEYDLLAYVPPHAAPRVVRDAGLAPEGGWVSVDRHTLETSAERVHAVGDVVTIPLAMGKPLPKAGVFAAAEAEVVARNVARAVTGKGESAAFDGEGACFVEIGGGRAAFGTGDFFAEPLPRVRFHAPGRIWHLGKVLYERRFLRRWL